MNGFLKMIQILSYPVSNWQASKKFYGETLGLPVALGMDEAGWIEYGDKDQVHLAIMRPMDGSPVAPTRAEQLPSLWSKTLTQPSKNCASGA